jgi:hypothetical protein
MTKVKVDLELLRKYFGEHYDFETNPSQYLRYWEYDLEGRQHKEYEAVYNDIRTLCTEYNLQDHIDIFFNLSFISSLVKITQDTASFSKSGVGDYKDQIAYKKELFSAFLAVLNQNSKSLSLKMIPIDSVTIIIKDSRLIDRFNSIILDSVAELFFHKKWEELSNGINFEIDPIAGNKVIKENERTQVIDDVTNWLAQFGSSGRGAPEKTHFITKFLQSMDDFIRVETNIFPSSWPRFTFIGKLGVIYSIIPRPGKAQAKRGDYYFAKTVANHLS